ncbi:MAG: hypothetical protein ACO3LE_05750 [Bdellovibrionota bacterium]|jgi:hypothetical protein
MSLSTLYVLFFIFSILLFNALILLARYINQAKMPPPEEEYDQLEQDRLRLALEVETQISKISELEMELQKLKDLQKQENENKKPATGA